MLVRSSLPRIGVATTKNKMELRMDQLDLVVFDMAGTTVQAADRVPAAFQQSFEQFGVKLSDEEIRSVRGRSKREAISDLLTRHLNLIDGRRLVIEVYSHFQRILMERYERQGVAPVDGADQSFEWLRARDVKVALSIGFDRALTDLLLKTAIKIPPFQNCTFPPLNSPFSVPLRRFDAGAESRHSCSPKGVRLISLCFAIKEGPVMRIGATGPIRSVYVREPSILNQE